MMIKVDVKNLKEEIMKQSEHLGVANENRINEFVDAYSIICNLENGNRWSKIGIELNDPCTGMGVISVTSKKLNYIDSAAFKKAAAIANNIELYPKINGTVQFNLTFYGLVQKNK